MKPLWEVSMSSPNMSVRFVRADSCEMGDDEALCFYDHPFRADYPRSLSAMFAPGQWYQVERIYEDGESENAANYTIKRTEDE